MFVKNDPNLLLVLLKTVQDYNLLLVRIADCVCVDIIVCTNIGSVKLRIKIFCTTYWIGLSHINDYVDGYLTFQRKTLHTFR